MKVKVNIEEVLSKIITISVPNGTDNIENYVEDKRKEMYKNTNDRYILSTSDFNGTMQIQLEYDAVTTEWFNPL